MNSNERKAVGAFLRSRRAKLKPEELGLPAGIYRRANGLRREEVATLAGVSVTWYTWIEQGREIDASPAVLESIARVLRLSADEQAYLFALVDQHPIGKRSGDQRLIEQTLQPILDHQGLYPAYILGRYWDFLAWNQAALCLFGDLRMLPAADCNLLWYTFMLPYAHLLVIDWEQRAQRLLAEFRADCGRSLSEPAPAQLIERINKANPIFYQWWQRQDVQLRDGGQRDFLHPQVGRLALQQTTLNPTAAPDLKLVLHLPLPIHQSAEKLALLAQSAPAAL